MCLQRSWKLLAYGTIRLMTSIFIVVMLPISFFITSIDTSFVYFSFLLCLIRVIVVWSVYSGKIILLWGIFSIVGAGDEIAVNNAAITVGFIYLYLSQQVPGRRCYSGQRVQAPALHLQQHQIHQVAPAARFLFPLHHPGLSFLLVTLIWQSISYRYVVHLVYLGQRG